MTQPLRLLFVRTPPDAPNFRRPPRTVTVPPVPSPPDPLRHAQRLRSELDAAWAANQRVTGGGLRAAIAVACRDGVYLEFHAVPGVGLDAAKIESRQQGIRLLNVRQDSGAQAAATVATVFVPADKRHVWMKKLDEYSNETHRTVSGRRKREDLINAILDIKLAVLESFWRDDPALLPGDAPVACEAWLYAGSGTDPVRDFQDLARRCGVELGNPTEVLRFPERVVVPVLADRRGLTLLLSEPFIAELRRIHETAAFWVGLSNRQQTEWCHDLLARLKISAQSSASVCLLDSGVNRGHPLLAPILRSEDCQAVDAVWGVHDTDGKGHGTLMAGLAAYGSLEAVLQGSGPVSVTHRLQSVKILPPPPRRNPAELYGRITLDAVRLAEKGIPPRARVHCMAVTESDAWCQGRPSSWSAEVDAIAAGIAGGSGTQRLVVLAAGNSDPANWSRYPDANLTDYVQSPGQSWNALTVGAYTEKVKITEPTLDGYCAVAAPGDLSPFSTTSLTWETRKWPVKPDIVLEGGNVAKDPGGFCTECDDLSLLSTAKDPAARHLDTISMTSAASAQAACMAARLLTAYPEAWPETVRGLLVHTAEWTPAMRQRLRGREQERSRAVASRLRLWRSEPAEGHRLHAKQFHGHRTAEAAALCDNRSVYRESERNASLPVAVAKGGPPRPWGVAVPTADNPVLFRRAFAR